MRILRIVVAAIVVVVATIAAWSLPPAHEPLALTSAVPAGVRGAIHVHTRRSDGTGTIDEVAAAAQRAGLRFVVITDHGDGTRAPEAPSYRSGVLVIDAVEISTTDGHLVALDLGSTPYPLGGEGRDVVEDVRRLGGMSIAAHPGSPKPELRWTDWDARFDGLEWLNGDSEWRDERALDLLRALTTYMLRPAETVGHLLDRPEAVMRQWDALTQQRRVVAVAAGDAHARLALRSAPDPYDGSAALRVPSYEEVFRAFSIVIPRLRLTRDAVADARAVLDAIRGGHVFSSIDALASPAAVAFTAVSGAQQASGGDVLAIEGPVALRVASNAPGGSTITLLRNGEAVATSQQAALEFSAPPEPAVFRAEIALSHASGTPPVPWVVTNPIYVGRSAADASPVAPAVAAVTRTVYDGAGTDGWRVEKSVRSSGAFDVTRTLDGTELKWRYALGGALSDGPYVALAFTPVPNVEGFDRLTFSARADKPTRVSVQARIPHGGDGERWHRSVYLDTEPRVLTVFFADMRPRGTTRSPRPPIAEIESLLWVVEPPTTPLGASGAIWIDDVRYGR